MILSRYLTREAISSVLLITGILILALLSQQIVRYLNYVAAGKIPTQLLFTLIGFEIPYLLTVLFPLGVLLGILLAYSRLYQDFELPLMLVNGFSLKRLYAVTLAWALVIFFLSLALMMWVNPYFSFKRQQLLASDETTLHLIKTLIPGRFQVSPDGKHVMYVEKLSRNRMLAKRVFLAQEKPGNSTNPQGWNLVVAKEGYQAKEESTGQPLFVMHQGFRYEGVPGENDYKIIQFNKYTLRLPQNDIRLAHQASETLPTSWLLKHVNNKNLAAEFQWRLALPISILFLAIIAVQLSLFTSRERRFVLMIPGLLIYVVYLQSLYVARRWLEQGSMPIHLGLWPVHGIVFLFIILLGFIHLRRFRL